MDPGFRRKKRKDKIYNKLHKGFVNICIGITVINGIYLGYKVYEYFRYIRPLHLAQSKIAEEELLHEGKNMENLLNAKLST